jgi:hypothetical protein
MSSSLRPRVALALVVAAVVIVSGCGGEEAETLRSTTTATPATTGAADGKVDEGGGDESGVGSWARTAGPSRGRIGELVEVDCDPDGEASAVWGTNVYTDDSSVCTAAVHQGLIDFSDGGAVTIQIEEGQDAYVGSEANGVTTSSYGSWGGSFSFPDAEPLEVTATIDWSSSASAYADRGGSEFTVECEPDGVAGSVWGTGTYTDDSSVCTAAVHAGLITLADGGEVTFRLIPGEESYAGSSANGIDSSDYGSWGASFELVEG